MKNVLSLLFTILITYSLWAQTDDTAIAPTRTPLEEVEVVMMPALDNESLMEAELERRGPGIAPRYAEHLEVDINPDHYGLWETLPSGNDVWRLQIVSVDAYSLNLGFTQFYMPEDGSLIIYSPTQKRVMGPFTPADNEHHEQLWTPIFNGDHLVIEVQVPSEKRQELRLHLSAVNHDFAGFSSMISGSCNLDVICGADDGFDIVDRYRDIIQSVAVIGTGGGTFCTGFLINNARNDCMPYFMTAAHCGIGSGNAPSLVAYWNYQNSICRQPNSPQSGGAGDGSLADFNTGSIFRAGYAPTDFTLVEFDDPVSETANGFFAGWVVDDTPPQDSVVCVHHPSTDEKRISFEYEATYLGDWGGGDNENPNGNHLIVPDWDLGTTEGGSSGSPLFDNEGHVVGQLHGGAAACGNNAYDSYGWFTASWEGGGTPTTRLKDWLDPDDTGITELEGRYVQACSFFVQPNVTSQEICAPDAVVFELEISENFTQDVMISLENVPEDAIAELSENPASPGSTIQLTISNTDLLGTDTYEITITGTAGMEDASSMISLSIFQDVPAASQLVAPADTEEGVAIFPTLDWMNQNDASTYQIEVATDDGFTDIIMQMEDLTESSIITDMLESQAIYYWRVRATNFCGVGDWSSTFSFTTAAVSCAPFTSTDVPVAISNSGTPTVTSTLEVNLPGTIADIRVMNLDIEHTYVGDLQVTLISPMGTEVVLVDRPGFPATTFGCDGDDLLLNIADDAPNSASDLENACGNQPAITGDYQPVDPLSDFSGEPLNGTWTLSVKDNFSEDGGSIEGWQLDICASLPNDMSITSTEESVGLCVSDTFTFDILLGTAFDDGGVNLTASGLPGGSTVEFSENPAAPGGLVSVTISDIPDPGTYILTIVGDDGSSQTSLDIDVEALGGPAAFNLLSPADASVGVPLSSSVSWEDAPTADEYTLEIATDPDFNNIIINSTQSSTSYNFSGLEFGTVYYWRVDASNECGDFEDGAVFSFTTLLDLSFTVSPPSQDACPGDDLTYTINIGSGFMAPTMMDLPDIFSFDFDPNNITPPATLEVTIENVFEDTPGSYANAITIDDGTNSAELEVIFNMEVLPAVPVLVSPTNNEIVMIPTPGLEWNEASDADEYIILISTSEDFENANIVDEATVTGTNYVVSVDLDPGIYYWRVSAENDCGGSTSAPRLFEVDLTNSRTLNGGSISFLPNPTSDIFQIRFSEPLSGELIVEVFAVNGQILQQKQLGDGILTTKVDLTTYADGVYLIRLINNDNSVTRRVILQK